MVRGDEFLGAFKAIAGPVLSEWPHAAYFLLGHSLELLLKAHLAANGTSKPELRKIGHDLTTLHANCERCGLPAVKDLDNLVAHLALMNSDQDFRYPTAYRMRVPSAPECLVVMEALRCVIEPVVEAAHLTALSQAKRDTQHLKGVQVIWSD